MFYHFISMHFLTLYNIIALTIYFVLNYTSYWRKSADIIPFISRFSSYGVAFTSYSAFSDLRHAVYRYVSVSLVIKLSYQSYFCYINSVLLYFFLTLDGHDESTVLLDMCHDMKTGMSYRNREKWHVDACTSCSCVSGRALCVAATCPVTCWNAVHVEGKCCPDCDLDEGKVKLSSQGVYFINNIE